MNYGLDWGAYGRASWKLQYADGVRWKRLSSRRSRNARELMKPSEVSITWPGWHNADIRSWW